VIWLGCPPPPPPHTHTHTPRAEPYSRGSYSFVAVGASGQQYDQLAQPVGGGRWWGRCEAPAPGVVGPA
jgi:hypothetical protein